jgi:NTE family protein
MNTAHHLILVAGALGEGLAELGLHPDWTAGISIGAINAALIAGNPPAKRVDKLREFWELITSPDPQWQFPHAPTGAWLSSDGNANVVGDAARILLNQWSAGRALCLGAPGFFAPRPLLPWLLPHGTSEATSYYDTRPLKATVERLVDFDRIKSGAMRFSVGAVNVRSGNFVYFDSTPRAWTRVWWAANGLQIYFVPGEPKARPAASSRRRLDDGRGGKST